MHLNWERLSLSGYFEALEAHNEAQDTGKPKHEPASPEFREQMRGVFAAENKKKVTRDE